MKCLLPKKEKLQKGQAVLVVLLIMSVLLTIGLSAVSRSVTDVKVSQQTQESARAFWTAQAELEKAMLTQDFTPGGTDGVSYSVTKVDLGGGSEEFVFPEKIDQGESAIYWLVDHNLDGSIGSSFYSGNFNVFWGNEGDTGTALIVTLVYKDVPTGLFRSQKFTYDPNQARSPSTNFAPASPGGTYLEKTYAHSTGQISLPSSQTYFANIKMIFNPSPQVLRVVTGSDGPVQGSCYESTATVDVSNIVRRLRECRTWPKTPEIFDYLLFSEGNLKNE